MTKNRQKLLIFDAMGVIFDFPEGDDVKYGLWPFLEEKGFKFSDEEKCKFEMEIYKKGTAGEISSSDFLSKILPSEADCKLIEEEYLFSEKFKLTDGLIPTLEKLKDEFHFGVLSNDFAKWGKKLRQRFDIEKYFSLVVISDEAKSRKPEEGIYKYFMKRLERSRIDAEMIYFVDDSLNNLHAASKFGFKTIYRVLKTNDKHPYQPHHKIMKLKELTQIL